MTTTHDSDAVIDLRDTNGDADNVHRETSGDTLVVTEPPRGGVDISAPAPLPRTTAPAPAVRTDTAAIASQGLTIFGALVAAMIAFLFVFSGFAEARAQVGLRRRFANDTQNLRAPIGGAIATGIPVAQIDIPAIGLHQIVVQGTTSGTLRSGPGHLRQSPLPGQEGNSVIFGRKAAYGGAFRHISSLSPGEHIVVTTGEGHFTYIVDRVHMLAQTDGSELVSTGLDQLTLVTSDPAFFASRRLVVVSHLRGNAYAASADPTPVTRAELGLSGETDGVLSLVLWLEFLLIAAVGATWLWRRWTRWSAYVVCAPVLLAITWLVFENLTKLLPATL